MAGLLTLGSTYPRAFPSGARLSCCTSVAAFFTRIDALPHRVHAKHDLSIRQWLSPDHERSIQLMIRRRASSPITAAGPSRILTGFPIMPERATTRLHVILALLWRSILSCQEFSSHIVLQTDGRSPWATVICSARSLCTPADRDQQEEHRFRNFGHCPQHVSCNAVHPLLVVKKNSAGHYDEHRNQPKASPS